MTIPGWSRSRCQGYEANILLMTVIIFPRNVPWSAMTSAFKSCTILVLAARVETQYLLMVLSKTCRVFSQVATASMRRRPRNFASALTRWFRSQTVGTSAVNQAGIAPATAKMLSGCRSWINLIAVLTDKCTSLLSDLLHDDCPLFP